ncbi:CoA transferase, partial [Lysobacter sp. 2RAB21]
NPTGVQAGLALRHDPERARVPDIDGFLARVRDVVGLGAQLQSTATRAGLIPCGGPVFPLARDGVMLTGDAAGIVSPVTAGGIHSAWAHGETLGQAIALHARGIGPAPESIAQDAAPKFRRKRALRWAFDRVDREARSGRLDGAAAAPGEAPRAPLDPHRLKRRLAPLHVGLALLFRLRDRDYWLQRLNAVDCCVSPVLTLSESLRDEQVLARGMVEDYRGKPAFACPIRYENARTRSGETPELGADNEAIFKSIAPKNQWRE